jgi:GntR family transcriptional repressor for pyruvate dehydrogenase complex
MISELAKRTRSVMMKTVQVLLKPIQRTTLSEALFEKLVGHVVNGDWKPGDRIPAERELSQQLGIGRASLREALKALELLGIIESRVGDGTFVCPRSDFMARPLLWAIAGTDQSELQDLIDARLAMEEAVAGFAAERATSEDVQRIQEAHIEMRDHLHEAQLSVEGDMRFHAALSAAAHNQILQHAVELLRNLMKPWIVMKHKIPGAAARSYEQHERVIAAILNRSSAQAREAMRSHIASAGRVVIEEVVSQR